MFYLASGRLVYTNLIVIAGLAVIGAWIWFCRPVAPLRICRTAPLIWRAAFGIPLLIYTSALSPSPR